MSQPFMCLDHKIVLVDTPGPDNAKRSDESVVDEIAEWVKQQYAILICSSLGKNLMFPSNLKRGKFIGVIFLYSLESLRAGNSVVRYIELLRKKVVDKARNVVVATTKWDIAKSDAQKRHDRLCDQERFFGAFINDGAEVMGCWEGRRNEVLHALIKLHESPIEYVLVMGATGAGKTSVSIRFLQRQRLTKEPPQFINEVSGSKLRVSDDTYPCTSEVQTSRPFRYLNHRIVLVDTPGLDNPNRVDEDAVTYIIAWLKRSYVLLGHYKEITSHLS